ncbi:MAG: Type 1 glutamine amidotransferase-like domain-containing protein [Clostridia bacterium]|nr:Type 1 glutamine amidotransferase-like domain-containing protein [Clostridia bacterium]
MILYLSSNKLGNKTDFLIDWIKNNSKKIVIIANARDAKTQNDEEKEKLNKNIEMLKEIGFEVNILDLKDYFGNNELLNKELKKYNSFCVIGGNVFVLRRAMKLSGFDQFLINNQHNHKLLYIGYSAGSCVLTKNLDGFQLVDEPINPYNDENVIYEGVGLLDYCIVPHYKSNHKESALIDNVVQYMEERKIKYKALSDGDVIIQK